MSHVGLSMRDDHGSATSRRPPRRGRRGAGLVAVLLIVVLAAAAVFAAVLLWRQYGPQPPPADYPGPGTGQAIVVVAEGDTVSDIGDTLAEEDVVASAEAFVQATEGDDRATTITPGTYKLRQGMPAADAFEALLDPANRYDNTITLPEGLRIDQTVDRTAAATGLSQQALWDVLRSPTALELPQWAKGTGELRAEGFLFPATYDFDKGTKARSILQTYVDRFDQTAADVGITDAPDKVGVSPYEALIVASLVQAEGREEDFAKVARVIYNRLDPKTWGGTFGYLQLDATLNYAEQEARISLSDEQLQEDGPYNTYTRPGLPPTPINSPGRAALKAALNPAEGDWLYYVTTNPDTGETKFTSSYEEFLTYKAEFEEWLRTNG